MKSKKTKKILGGVAIAAVSLGCLGLAGIANAATTTGTTTGSTSTTSDAYQLGSQTGAMTGSQTITVSTSKAQGETLSDHHLEYIKIGSYFGHGDTFSTQAASQDIENELYSFATAASGGLKTAFPDAAYAASDGEALNWMLTENDGGTFLGADASGQAVGTSTDYAVRLLANWLYTNIGSLGATPTQITLNDLSTANGYQTGTFSVDSPGVYLIVDTSNVNQSLPILLSTMPTKGYQIPTSMTDFVTNNIALKTQDPQAAPVKQFVSDATYPTASGADFSDTGSLTGTMSSTIGSSNLVTYQVSNVLPNTNGYPSYTYNFIDYPGMGLTLSIQGGKNMYVAGIPISTLVSKGTVIFETMGGKTTTYGTASGDTALTSMPDLVGAASNASELKVSLNEASMQYIQDNGYQTSNVDGQKINFAKFSSNTTPAQAVNGTTNKMAGGANGGASSYTGQTVAAAKGENGNKDTTTATQATGELFGLTYQGYLNQGSGTTMSNNAMPTTGATNTAETQNNGSTPMSSSQLPLTTSGGYNGTDTNGSGKKQGTTQVNPTNTTHSQDGIPTKDSAGAGINWMKIWGSGSVATGAAFYVTRPASAPGNTSGAMQYLYATGSGWGWTTNKSNAQMIEAATLYNGTDSAVNPKAAGGLFEITGLASGVTYTVTEAQAATGADPNALPSFQVTLNSDGTETVSSTSGSLNLVNNTPGGNPFNSNMYNTVENVKSLSGLPLTGGAGILTGVIAAVVLFGTAGIVLVVYKKRKARD